MRQFTVHTDGPDFMGPRDFPHRADTIDDACFELGEWLTEQFHLYDQPTWDISDDTAVTKIHRSTVTVRPA